MTRTNQFLAVQKITIVDHWGEVKEYSVDIDGEVDVFIAIQEDDK